MQDIAYASLLRSKRQQLHAGAAVILEQRFPHLVESEPELLAHHYMQAAMPDRAIAYCQKAARSAADRSVHLEAIAHLRKQPTLWHRFPTVRSGTDTSCRYSWPLAYHYRMWKAQLLPKPRKSTSEPENSACEREPSKSDLPRCGACGARTTCSLTSSSAHTLATELLRLAQEEEEPALLLQAHHALWANEYEVGSLQVILEHVAAGLALYDEREHRSATYLLSGHDPGVCALGCKADAIWQLGFPSQAAKLADDAVALARKLDHPIEPLYSLYQMPLNSIYLPECQVTFAISAKN